jgi:hypothetical protein
MDENTSEINQELPSGLYDEKPEVKNVDIVPLITFLLSEILINVFCVGPSNYS